MSDLLLFEIEAPNGARATIHGPGSGAQGIELDESPEGLWETPTTTIWTEGARQEGGTYNGFRHNMQDVILPVHISPTDDMSWQQVKSRWSAMWEFDRITYLVATSSSGIRRLGLQKVETPKFNPRNDPGRNRYGHMVMTLRAGWPFWVEKDEVDVFQSKAGALNGSVTLANPTNRPMYPKWVIDAPQGGQVTLPDFSWITDPEHEDYEWRGRVIDVPTLSPGEKLTIRTYPDEETYDSNINPLFWARANSVEFEFAVPPHTLPVDVPIKCTVPNMTVAVYQPRHWTMVMGGEE
ncbi:phage tail protein [Rhodococcus sp. BH5]|uniref:phage tail protein n=1 Tax=Rhodococcus sp. BH5 TaxID=2871702 RepID=UPI0022CDAE00|nr:phage tail protein [Rhodococcus sp. BH5]MCZ9635162.1 phage tail protein [Rhodococcus sp. BH5]